MVAIVFISGPFTLERPSYLARAILQLPTLFLLDTCFLPFVRLPRVFGQLRDGILALHKNRFSCCFPLKRIRASRHMRLPRRCLLRRPGPLRPPSLTRGLTRCTRVLFPPGATRAAPPLLRISRMWTPPFFPRRFAGDLQRIFCVCLGAPS